MAVAVAVAEWVEAGWAEVEVEAAAAAGWAEVEAAAAAGWVEVEAAAAAGWAAEQVEAEQVEAVAEAAAGTAVAGQPSQEFLPSATPRTALAEPLAWAGWFRTRAG